MEDTQQDAPASPSTRHLARFLANDPRVVFPRRLREARTQAGLTQQQLADEINLVFKMHRSAIAKIESGERPVLLAEAVAFAQILGVNLGYLLSASDTDREHAHIQRVAAQLEVEALAREAGERYRLAQEAQVLLDNTQDRLAAARKRLAELEKDPQPAGPSDGYDPADYSYEELPDYGEPEEGQ
jgi:transcriptional regulator with XRE-family HTH domain